MKTVAVVGAGISGLTVAYRLKNLLKNKASVILFEKNSYPGGTIFTERTNGFVIEAGPDCFITDKPWAKDLAKELGIEDQLVGTIPENRNTFILWDGKLHPIPEGLFLMVPTKFMPLLKSQLFTLRGKMRMGMDLFIPAKKDDRDESLSEFVMRRLGKEALERIAEPLVAGIHAGEPESMSIKSSFPRFVDMEKKYRSLILGMLKMRRMLKGTGRDVSLFMTFKSGLYELIEKLVEVIDPGSIRTNALVQGIKKQGNLFTLHLNDGSTFHCDAIVLALPSYVSGSILKDINPGLSKILDSIPFVSTATISLAYEKKNFSHPLNGYGFVIPRTEKRKIMAVTWTSSKFPYRVPDGFVMLRTFVGGVYNRNMVSMSDEELLKIVTDELRSIMGISTRPYLYRIFRWHNSMPQYTVGHEEKIKKIDEELEKLPGLFLTGSSYKGIGISECIKNAGEVAERIGRFIGL